MNSKLSMEAASDILAGAFSPFGAHVRTTDGGAKLAVTVFGTPQLIREQEFTRQQVTDPRRLESIIRQLREHLEEHGQPLRPWSLPNDQ